jgi:hypothetical protein
MLYGETGCLFFDRGVIGETTHCLADLLGGSSFPFVDGRVAVLD